MALIPGSYARAAGLQSEINKVTVTRVAGNEVHFRRTIDTYQRDLRYNIGQIGREQMQLRRTMRRYSKKLHDSRRERKERLAKAKEDSTRLKYRHEQFLEAEEAARRLHPTPVSSHSPSTLQQHHKSQQALPDDVVDRFDNNHRQEQLSQESVLPESPDSGIAELDEISVSSAKDASQKHSHVDAKQHGRIQKAFVAYNKGKVPYLKAKTGQKDRKTKESSSSSFNNNSDEEYREALIQTSHSELLLPVIDEVNEDVEQLKPASTNSMSKHGDFTIKQQNKELSSSTVHASAGRLPSVIARSLVMPVKSLDTKSLAKRRESVTVTEVGQTDQNGSRKNSDIYQSIHTATSTVKLTWKKTRRKAMVSYGDLIKLQHTHGSSTKHLFKLVDHLASLHGIVDLPAATSSKAASLDPRVNVKIKRRGDGPVSQMSDGMVKQAAVLYSIKYGYGVPSEEISVDTTHPHLHSDQYNCEDKSNQWGAVSAHHVYQRHYVGGVSDVTSRRQSLPSARRESLGGVTSSFYKYSDSASALLDGFIPDGASHPRGPQEHPSRRGKNRRALSLSQLSDEINKVRERTLQTVPDDGDGNTQPDISVIEANRENRPARKLSPLTRRRDSVESQLQKRLNEDENWGYMAWQSAFGRLKILHTLHDLSQHFRKAKR